jgi:hypothetical protein
MEALNCTYEEYRKAVGFSGLSKIVKTEPDLSKFFRIENGGMRLPTVKKEIRAISPLDQFVANEFLKFSDPDSRLFGENTFVVVGTASNYSVGHLERYCGPTLRMDASSMRAKSGGPIVALAHTHPLFRGANASSMNRDGARFGPADWVPMVAFQCPVYLYTPSRKIHVMEYDGNFVTVRGQAGGASKWRVSSR